MMLITGISLCLLITLTGTNGRTIQSRQTDSLSVMREKCQKTPSLAECVSIKAQMEDLLRKCRDMTTPVAACNDVRSKYCFIWPLELFCYSGGGGTQVPSKPPSWNNDPDWYQIPVDPNELRQRGDYCVAHQSEQKCRNLLNALKIRYDECAKKPKTDAVCQSFKTNLCAAFPKFSPCLNGGAGSKREIDRLRRLVGIRRRVR